MTTIEAAKAAGVPEHQLLRWQRDGYLTPTTNGMSGRQRRIEWSEKDVAQAKQIKGQDELKSKSEVVLDALGGETLIEGLTKARGCRDKMLVDEMLIVGPCGHRIVKKTAKVESAVVFSGTPAIIFRSENL